MQAGPESSLKVSHLFKKLQSLDENIDGGHAAAANQTERAKRTALEFTYLSRKLAGPVDTN